MVLKEAFRFQNHLDNMLSRTLNTLNTTDYTMKITREHLRSKANPDGEDEVVDMSTERHMDVDANTLMEFAVYLMSEKEKLGKAIRVAKDACEMDIDSEIANNKIRQKVASTFTTMGRLKPTERMLRGNGYKLNAEGNQVPYTYDVKEVSVIDFDRNRVKKLAKEIAGKADGVSTAIDGVMVSVEVDYTPLFTVNDTYEDAIEMFKGINE